MVIPLISSPFLSPPPINPPPFSTVKQFIKPPPPPTRPLGVTGVIRTITLHRLLY